MQQRILFPLGLFCLVFVVSCSKSSVVPDVTVSSFEECVAAGNPVMESYPRQCRHNDQHFTEVLSEAKDLLGMPCTQPEDCRVPMEYAVQSNCPYQSACIEQGCAVTCPLWEHSPNAEESVSYQVSCNADEDCDCENWDASGSFPCSCIEGSCASVVASLSIFADLLAEKHHWDRDLLEVHISDMTMHHVYGGVKFFMDESDLQGGGGYFFATNIYGPWEIVLDGNGQISCELLERYEFPERMQAQCV